MNILERLAASRWDIAVFARLMGVEPHPGQIRMWEAAIMRDHTRWKARYLTVAESAGNRAGKTLAIALMVMHHNVHKMGMRPPDPSDDREVEAWLRSPYHWYHFGIQQEVSELVYFEMAALLEGRHVAQKRQGCPLVDELGQVARFDTKERGEYRWVVWDKMLGGAETHFRTTNEKALGSLGKDMNGISFDECGFESNLSFIVNEVLHLRRLGTGGPMFLISTPSEGFTQFSDEWKRGDLDDPKHEPYRISLRMSTRENVGYGIDAEDFARLVAGMPPSLIPQNIDGYFIEGRNAFFNHEAVDAAFTSDLPAEQSPQRGHEYVHGCDPALTHDATWGVVLDITSGNGVGVAARRKEGKQTLVNVVAMVESLHTRYDDPGGKHRCVTGLDTTGFGGKVFKDSLSGIMGLRSVEFGGTKNRKVKLLTDLKGLLEQGRLRFPREGLWLDLRRQLLGFRLDKERDIATDAVMALAIAAKLMLASPPGAKDDAPFSFFGGSVPPKGDDDPYHGDFARRRMALRTPSSTSRMPT